MFFWGFTVPKRWRIIQFHEGVLDLFYQCRLSITVFVPCFIVCLFSLPRRSCRIRTCRITADETNPNDGVWGYLYNHFQPISTIPPSEVTFQPNSFIFMSTRCWALWALNISEIKVKWPRKVDTYTSGIVFRTFSRLIQLWNDPPHTPPALNACEIGRFQKPTHFVVTLW